ncbi:MAG: hypothetical protein JWN79_2372 [Gemmatimonadetes bacterium]|nr:hypothetical protein [Gemmatimonadota bacterium]
MRTRFVILAGTAALATLAGCGPLPQVVYVPAPATEAVAELPPVGVTIARADEGRLLVSTNQPAYVAVFELVPNRGVALVYPVTRAQRQATLSGSSWLSLLRRPMRDERYARDDRFDRDGRYDRDGRASSVRYLYAVASDRPLRLPDAAFEEEYLREVLGARDYRATDPYRTIEALSRRFVAPGMEDEWGEDLYTIDAARPAITRIAKVYCPDGSVLYVRDEMAERGACPSRARGRGPGVAVPPVQRPDSVVASNGHAVARPASRVRPPVFRVPTRSDVEEGVQQQGNTSAATGRGENGNGGRTDTGRPARSDSTSTEGRKKDHDDNGNHYGRDGGKPEKGDNGNNGNNGRGRLGSPAVTVAPVREHSDTTMRRPQPEPTPVQVLPTLPASNDAPKSVAPADSGARPKRRFIPTLPRPAAVPDSASRPAAPDAC